MRALLHELVRIDRFYHLVKDRVNAVDQVVSMSRFEHLHQSLEHSLCYVYRAWIIACFKELSGHTLQKGVQFTRSDDIRPGDKL